VARRILVSSADASDDAFLRSAYLGILGREPDADGAAWYRGRLAGGS